MCSIRGHTHGIKTLEFESDSTQRLQLLDLRWIVHRLPGFWGRGINKSIFHCARSTPLTPAWFKGQLYLPFYLWIVHQSALTPSIVASRPTPHSVPFYLLLCLVAQSCPTLCDPMDCSPPGSPSMGILQARILEWVAISSSRDLPNLGMEPRSPALQAYSLPSQPPGKPCRFPLNHST